MNNKNITIVNNTAHDLSAPMFHKAIIKSIKTNKLVDELSDLLTLEIIKDGVKITGVIKDA